MFETWAVNAIRRQFVNLTVAPQAYHWRTAGGAEADIVLERDGRLYPIEVKCKTNLTGHDARGLRAFRETYARDPVMTGLIVYAGSECYRVDEHTIALPWNAAFRPVAAS
jgi:predicted AAA+ superfamily ATPase